MYNNQEVEYWKQEFSVAGKDDLKTFWEWYNHPETSKEFILAFELYFGINQ